MDIEKYIIIPGYDGRYEISNWGNVKSNTFLIPRNLKFDTYIGYYRIKLKRKNYLVHRIVAKAFIPNPENKPQVNHINGIKTDNRLENLEWVTSSENNQHAYSFLKRKFSNSKLSKESIIEIRDKFNKGIKQKELKEFYHVSHSTISEIINNKRYKNEK